MLTTGRRITTKEALIKTASVEIKALTINGKQVTLAVFRQLIEEQLWDDETFDFHGIPWGTVNYHPSTLCSDSGHLHVVWQCASELRRTTVYESCPSKYLSPLSRKREELVRILCCLESLEYDPPLWWDESHPFYAHTAHGIEIRIEVPQCVRSFLHHRNWLRKYPHGQKDSSYMDRVQNVIGHWTIPMIESELDVLTRLYITRKNRWQALYSDLSQLDQLFIAV